jgi:hypothetical protein
MWGVEVVSKTNGAQARAGNAKRKPPLELIERRDVAPFVDPQTSRRSSRFSVRFCCPAILWMHAFSVIAGAALTATCWRLHARAEPTRTIRRTEDDHRRQPSRRHPYDQPDVPEMPHKLKALFRAALEVEQSGGLDAQIELMEEIHGATGVWIGELRRTRDAWVKNMHRRI